MNDRPMSPLERAKASGQMPDTRRFPSAEERRREERLDRIRNGLPQFSTGDMAKDIDEILTEAGYIGPKV
jgi:hypothetical protein